MRRLQVGLRSGPRAEWQYQRYVAVLISSLRSGGALAAPFAAYATRHLPERPLMILVGALVVLLSARGLVRALG